VTLRLANDSALIIASALFLVVFARLGGHALGYLGVGC
jgi:hypothetical protein